MLFEQLFVLLVGKVPANILTEIVEDALADVEAGDDFLFEGFELLKFVDEELAGALKAGFELYPFIHEFPHFLIEQ